MSANSFLLDELDAEFAEQLDLFGKPVPAAPEPVMIVGTTGQAILDIRAMNPNKAKDREVARLNAAAIAMLESAPAECFYIKGDVRSSKNSKEIGVFKKRQPDGSLKQMHTLVESKASREYRRDTAGQWLANKVEFLNQVRELPIPLNLEFTFIRKTLAKFDYINAAQVLCDIMAEYGYYPDDETCYVKPIFADVYYHREMCGVLIRIIK